MKKYHQNYTWSSKPEENGQRKLVYTGDYYHIELHPGERNRILLTHIFLTISGFLLLILAGLINNSGSRNFFIAVPYAFLYFPYVYLFMTFPSFLHWGEQMKREAYDRSVGRTNRCQNGIICVTAYLSAAVIFHTLWKGMKELDLLNFVFLLIILIIGIITLCHKKYLYNLRKRFMIITNNL